MTNNYLVKKVYLQYMAPTILLVFASTAGTMIDALFVANLIGDASLQALNLSSPFSMMLMVLASMLGGGGAVLMGILIGQNKKDEANSAYGVSLFVAFILGLVITLLTIPNISVICDILGAKGELGIFSQQYLQGLIFSILPIFLLQTFMPFASRDSDPLISLFSILVLAITNASLDYLFCGIFSLGMFGMGLATSIAYMAALATVLTHLFKKVNTLKFHFSCIKKLPLIIKVCNFGMPSAIYNLSNTLRIWILNIVILSISTSGILLVSSAMNSVMSLIMGIVMGIASATAPLISIFYGEIDMVAIKDTLKVALKFGLIITLTIACFLIAFPGVVGSLFNITDPSVGNELRIAIRLFALSLPFATINSILLISYQSASQIAITNVFILLKTLIFFFLSIFALDGILGSRALWMSYLVAELLTFFCIVLYISLKSKRFVLRPYDLFYNKNTFTTKNVMEMSIQNNLEEATHIASKIRDFCIQNAIDERRAMLISLCCEEMAKNIVQHGFKRDSKHFIDIKLMLDDDGILLRIRDDGVMFNPLNYELKDRVDTIGINLVEKIAKTIDYRYSLKLNNLIITI
ncbi:MAG: MATE family efflux transporter [Eubacteriaceae bacterium]